MRKSKRILSLLLCAVLTLQLLPVLTGQAVQGTVESALSTALATTVAEGDFSTAELVQSDNFNGEGVWITEIHDNDVDRSITNDNRVSDGYVPVNLYDTGSDLMEFVELVSTYDTDVRFNDLYELYHDSTKLTVTTVDGSSDVILKRGQATVLWNYRTDVAAKTTIPTLEEFLTDMHIPDTAQVLKIVGTSGWDSASSFSLKSKRTGKTVCSFTTVNETNVIDGLSVELKLPREGSAMEVYRNMVLPSPGYVYASQVRYLIPARPVEGFNDGKGVYITEIRPNDVNRSGTYGSTSDLMECIEVFNNTDAAIDLNKDYKVTYTIREGHRKILQLYKYSSTATNFVGSSSGCTVPAGGTAVLWCFRYSYDVGASSFPTLTQFRNAYGLSSSTPVYIFTNQHSLNDTSRSIELFKANGSGLGQCVSTYHYNGTTDVTDNQSVHLKINPEGPEMLIYSENSASSMGTVPADQRKFTKDYGDMVWMHLADGFTVPEYVMQGEHLRVSFWYDFNGRTSRTATDTYYRFDGTGSFTKATEGGIRVPNIYELLIPAHELYEHDYVEFYVMNSNTLRDTIMGTYKVPIRKLNDVDGIRTNITEGEEVRGTVSITANDGGTNSATKIYIDGVQQSTTAMMEDGAYFSYVTEGLGGFGMNELTTTSNKRIAHVGNFMFEIPVKQLIHIDNSYFSYSSSKYNVTLRFWSGSPGICSEDNYGPSGSRDDYSVTQLQLKLPNGKSYLPASIGPSSYGGVSTSTKTNLSTALSAVHWVGDSSYTSPYLDVKFSVPASEVNAVGCSVNTANLTDGPHTLQVTNGASTRTVTFIVDNTAPGLDLGIADGSEITGDITISPKITEANGMKELLVKLDGELIDTPYATTAYALGEGSHTLEALVTDVAGNSTTKKITFNVGDISMTLTDAGATDISGTTARLYLTAQSDSAANATFYKAERIDAARIQRDTVSGLVPYLSYTIDVSTAQPEDEIVVSWNGTASGSDNTHACNLFVRNAVNGRWEHLGKADGTGSITRVSFPAENHVADGKATVIVQCTEGSNLPDTDTVNDGKTGNNTSWDGISRPNDYDFSFAWISDTQAYVQRNSYHTHFMKMNQWIVDNRENWKISYVMHTGDLVDDPDYIYQWENANDAMKIFDDAGMPYGVLAGNHDIYAGIDDCNNYWTYFGEDRVKNQPTFGASFQNNYGHYDLVSQNGQDFIIVYMSFNVYKEEIDWMNKVLAQYSNRKAILCFHSYTHVNDSMDGYLDYFGVMVRDKVVKKNPNVFAVLSGHYSGASYQTVRFDDNGDGTLDRTVYQICTDYQSVSQGGLQYIKFLYFDLDNDKVFVNSYSPYMDDYNYFDTSKPDDLQSLAKSASGGVAKKTDIDSMILTVDFKNTQQSITENSFSAAIYTDEELGTAPLSNGMAEVKAEGLTPETTQAWYAVLENEDTGYLRTDAYELTTGHDYVAAVTPPTCTAEGYTTYTCSVCGHQYVGDPVPVSGHTYGTTVQPPTCTTGGYTTYTCTACGDSYRSDVTSVIGHSYQSTVTPPTCTAVGYTTHTCSVCGASYQDAYTNPNGHSYQGGTCTACGAEDPDYVKKPTLGLKYPTVSFEDEIFMNVYFTIDSMDAVMELGMITYASKPASYGIDNAEQVIPGYTYSAETGYLGVRTKGIPAKCLGDVIYFSVYAQLTDGSYVYSSLVGYNPKTYAYGQLTSGPANMKPLVVAMLNYGAAAQLYFDYKTDTLVNADLTAAQKALVTGYDASMMDTVVQADSTKLGTFVNSKQYTKRYPTVSFEGAFCINYYFQPSLTPKGDITMYLWNQADFNAASTLTKSNATEVIPMELTATGEYLAVVEGIAAKDLDKGVYVSFVYSNGTNEYSAGVIGYSIGTYCTAQAAKTGTFADLAAATAVYGYYAKQAFYHNA